MYDNSCVTVFACLGFLSPNCKSPLTILFVPYAFLGIVAESVSACLHKRTGVLQWKNNVLMIAFLYPGIAFGIFFDLELVLWSYYSAEAILFTNFFGLVTFTLTLERVILVRISRNHIPLALLIK